MDFYSWSYHHNIRINVSASTPCSGLDICACSLRTVAGDITARISVFKIMWELKQKNDRLRANTLLLLFAHCTHHTTTSTVAKSLRIASAVEHDYGCSIYSELFPERSHLSRHFYVGTSTDRRSFLSWSPTMRGPEMRLGKAWKWKCELLCVCVCVCMAADLVSYVVVQHADHRRSFAVGDGVEDFVYLWWMAHVHLEDEAHGQTGGRWSEGEL